MAERQKVSLCQLPTPIHRLSRVSEDLGIDLWIKRDDLTGFAMGGNKGRKLEFLVQEILDSKAQVVVANGALQSNFIRQLGTACAMFGVRCVAVVMPAPFDADFGVPDGPLLGHKSGNVWLDELVGVEVREYPNAPWEELWQHAENVALELEAEGQIVYRMPVGGSSPLGAFAFYKASEELAGQGFETIVTSSSSGSTHAGLSYAFVGTTTKIIGIAADPEQDLYHDLARLANGIDEIAGRGIRFTATDFDLRFDWVGPGYGAITDEGMDAIRYLARTEGIFLDPVYSAKAFAGLKSLAAKGELTGPVLFWHTGGTPSLFALDASTE